MNRSFQLNIAIFLVNKINEYLRHSINIFCVSRYKSDFWRKAISEQIEN